MLLPIGLGGCRIYPYSGIPSSSESVKLSPRTENLSFLDYEKTPIHPTIQRIRKKGSYRIFRITFPSWPGLPEQEEQVVAYYYRPRGKGPRPAIVLLPIYDGTYLLERYLANYLTRHGFAVLRFERSRKMLQAQKGIAYTREAMRQTVIDIRRGVDWLVEQPHIDPQRLGILGTSFGSVVAALVAEADPRIKAAVLFLGGGDLGLLFCRSGEKEIIRFRERVMALNGYGPEEFCRIFSAAMREVDPLTHASRLDPARTLMINADWDQVVVPECTKRLWEASGRPRRILLAAGHYTAPLVYLWYVRSQARKHFAGLLQGP
ncbi:MAG: prolyl oligopeptidase family serine peptidase [Candidatus Tectomicrobia bacterium]|uniref:Prolyl oligopeptidase family serine peptidase n=1 Tax=Tectimicrobiota bacterium TaxID=2528274 RepID=A0A932CLQ0_UNCTE|nr:prolyl oligopeptidase family serine peptidase [Candidatus Tectomicrobia bacterium]